MLVGTARAVWTDLLLPTPIGIQFDAKPLATATQQTDSLSSQNTYRQHMRVLRGCTCRGRGRLMDVLAVGLVPATADAGWLQLMKSRRIRDVVYSAKLFGKSA
jgi:hypothetical protein